MFDRHAMHNGWRYTKRVIGDAWHGAVGFARSVDAGMNFGRRLLSAASPILDQLGQGSAMKPIMRGLTAYDQGKADVTYGVNNVLTHYNRIKKQVPELELG